MKLLSLHCDYIKFKPVQKAIKEPEALSEEQKKETISEECLVILTAVEQGDNENSVKKAVENIGDIASQVKAKKIVLYPYAHLSSNLAMPAVAERLLKDMGKALAKKFSVVRAPFGYYKSFELKCKGHPLSELSREIRTDGKEIGKEIKGLGKVEKIQEKELSENDRRVLLRELSKTKLDTSKLKENDHRILGQHMDLFSFNEVAPGMVFWHNNGWIIYNELVKYWREEHEKAGYQEVSTPFVLDEKIWKISGHWEKYKENIFLTQYENKKMAVKPMNCPGGILIYKTRPRSYKEFPMKVGELGIVHRQELSGVLAGLFRVIKFTQDDAHIYCKEKQLEQEIINIINLTEKVYKKLGFSYHVELSTRPAKRIGSDEMWDKAEKVLENVLKKKKMKFKLNKGEGAFYGPKIDFHIKDSQGRTWQCGTIQLDFAMPERFELTYIDEDNKEKRPVMLHRTVLGSFERFIGVLLEHTNGKLPTWLSPIQARVLSFTDRNIKAAKKTEEQLKESGIRVDSDLKSETIGNKVRNAELAKIPYIICIGDKEEKSKKLAVRERGNAKIKSMKIDKFIDNIKQEIAERK